MNGYKDPILIGTDYESPCIGFTEDAQCNMSCKDIIKYWKCTGFGHDGRWAIDIRNICMTMYDVTKQSIYFEEPFIKAALLAINASVIEELTHALGETHQKPIINWVKFILDEIL